MLENLNVDQARFIALLANAARAQRDALLGKVREADFGGVKASRGEHNPTAALGLDPLPEASPQTDALRDAVASLLPEARRELYVLMRIGQGDFAAKKWHRGLTEATNLGDDTVTGAILEDADLHDHVMKGLYEAELIG
ncbi:MAG: DUF3775 domain-containing protein [Pseudolabrys sp.]